MKKFCLLAIICCGVGSAIGQRTFDITMEGVEYKMKEYFVVFLKKGDLRDQIDPKEAERLMPMHLAYLGGLGKQGIIVLNGPFGDDEDFRGMSFYSVATAEEALQLASEDPMVKAGWLAVEVKPWFGAIGTCLK